MPDGWLFETAQVKLAGWMVPFGGMFTVPTWRRVLVLLIGAVLSPGRRTVAAAQMACAQLRGARSATGHL